MVELKKESDKTENENVKEENQNEQKETETTTETSTASEPVNASESTPKKQIKLPKNIPLTKELKIVTGVAILLIIIAGVWGHSVGYQSQIDSQTLKLDAKYRETYDKLENIKQELKDNEKTLKELENYKKNKQSLNDKLASVNKDIDNKNGELQNLNSQIEQKQQELDKLNGDIIQAKGQPLSLSAGQFVVGHDIPANRYNVSGSSNFIVYNSDGKLKVNTILGDRYGSGDYVCILSTGDIIDNHARATFTPIE